MTTQGVDVLAIDEQHAGTVTEDGENIQQSVSSLRVYGTGVEPASTALQAAASPSGSSVVFHASCKTACRGVEPRLTDSKSVVLSITLAGHKRDY